MTCNCYASTPGAMFPGIHATDCPAMMSPRAVAEALEREPRYAIVQDCYYRETYMVPEEFIEAWLDWDKSNTYGCYNHYDVPDYAMRLDHDQSQLTFVAPRFQ